jgi:hypothetical protein
VHSQPTTLGEHEPARITGYELIHITIGVDAPGHEPPHHRPVVTDGPRPSHEPALPRQVLDPPNSANNRSLGSISAGTRGSGTRLGKHSPATATVARRLRHAYVIITYGQDSYRLAQATAGKGVTPLTRPSGHRWRGDLMATTGEKKWHTWEDLPATAGEK